MMLSKLNIHWEFRVKSVGILCLLFISLLCLPLKVSAEDCPLDSKFEVATLSNNMTYYTDRAYTLTNVPSKYLGMTAIKTPNDEQNLTDVADYLTFGLQQDAMVYVAFDRRTATLPAWMNGFSYTGDTIGTSLTSQGYLKVYSKVFNAGDCVNFGGNHATPSSTEYRSNYIAFYNTTSACPLDSKFKVATLSNNMTYYTDRAYTLTNAPSKYLGMTAIKTPNDEQNLTDVADYLTFELQQDAMVYVAFDRRTATLPDWMNGFSYTGDTIATSLVSQGYLKVYSKMFTAGDCVNFGGNHATPSSTEYRSNYIVFYNTISDCPLDSKFGVTTLSNNMTYYTDRTYTLTNAPSKYIGMAAIKTPNDDQNLTVASDYLTFKLQQEAMVYVAFDRRTATLPNWMNGFSYTGDTIGTSLTSQGYLKVYSKIFAAGDCVNFGGNHATPSSTEYRSNYFVFWGPLSEVEIIIDNGDSNTSYNNTWYVSTTGNYYGSNSMYTVDHDWDDSGNSFYKWSFSPTVSGHYSVSMWWTVSSDRNSSTPVDVTHSTGSTTVHIDQRYNGGQWNILCVKYFEAGSNYTIKIIDQSDNSSTCADAVKLSLINDPIVRIINPYSFYLQETTELNVLADTANLQPDWDIKFILDKNTVNEQSITVSTAPFQADFMDISIGEHTLDALVVDSIGAKVPGIHTQDQKRQIGVGEYYVAVGDSITVGYGDDESSDNTSTDERNCGGGYTPILNDQLTDFYGVPHTIIDEGIGGTTSKHGKDSIYEILARHPHATRVLVQYGTNDAATWWGPIPDGLNTYKGDAAYPGTFKANMQSIIDAVVASGKEVCLAKTPIAIPIDGSRNIQIQKYNQVIDQLINDPRDNNTITIPPPDFYNYFINHQDEYSDSIHPNGIGYQSMAELWFESLTQ